MKKMADNGFEDWLCKKLTSLDIDNEVYGSYITGILQETDKSERKEALQEVLNSFIESSEDLCDDVVAMWESFRTDNTSHSVQEDASRNINDIFAAHAAVTTKKVSTSKSKPSAQSDSVKQAVLAMYSAVADGEDENEHRENADDQTPHRSSVDAALEIMKNTNAERIAQAEKEERMKKKEENAKKKEQDKLNRELQKIKKAERKDKEKKRTQKKERGR